MKVVWLSRRQLHINVSKHSITIYCKFTLPSWLGWNLSVYFEGEKGDSGKAGNRGPKGVPGDKGEQGESIKGDPGVNGQKGETGLPGHDGQNGLTGLKGAKGSPGVQGLSNTLYLHKIMNNLLFKRSSKTTIERSVLRYMRMVI